MDDFEQQIELQQLKVRVLDKVFSSEKVKKRVNQYLDDLYVNKPENRKVRKAFKNQLMDIIKKENAFVKENIRFVQRKKPMRIRKKREYKPTSYVLFCREMREKHPSNELAGKMQQLWRERCGKTEEEYEAPKVHKDPTLFRYKVD